MSKAFKGVLFAWAGSSSSAFIGIMLHYSLSQPAP